MPYTTRTCGPKGYRHDPAAKGIFIHGGTCLMHDRGEAFATEAKPNGFGLTFPLVGEFRLSAFDYEKQPTFNRALSQAKRIREIHPELHAIPIFACTDLIKDKPWSGSFKVQRVA